jgi:glycosyltransferase involved in cell wall biosynthesis
MTGPVGSTDKEDMATRSDDTQPADAPLPVDLVFCVDPLSLRRFRAMLRYMCVGLLDAAANIRLITSSPEAESLLLGSVQHVVHKPLTWPFRARRTHRLLGAIAGRAPNIVHAVSGRSYGLATTIARHFDAHVVVHCVGLDDVETLTQHAGQPVARVIAASRPIHDAVLEDTPVRQDRLALIRPGLISGDSPTCFVRPERIPTILCTSQLFPRSGVDRLLEALRILGERGHQFMAFFTGSGPMEGGLRKVAESAGLASAVTFAEPLGEAKQIMAGADLFVRPAIERALSIRSLQAMAAGMALVTVDGGAADAHINEVTGLVCPDSRPITLAMAIERLLTDHAYARTLASRAIEHMKRHHSVSAMCEALVRMCSDLSLRDRTLSVSP